MKNAKNGEPEKRHAGRPTTYRTEYDDLAFKFCLLGATDVELAGFFEVTEQTINNWKQDHPKFFESIKAGRVKADAVVSQKLYHRAVGYSAPDTDIRVIDGQIVKTEIIKHYPPDTTAAIFWLKNRQRGKWRDRQETDLTVSISDDFKRALDKVKAQRDVDPD